MIITPISDVFMSADVRLNDVSFVSYIADRGLYQVIEIV